MDCKFFFFFTFFKIISIFAYLISNVFISGNDGGCPTEQGTTLSRNPYEENSEGIAGLYRSTCKTSGSKYSKNLSYILTKKLLVSYDFVLGEDTGANCYGIPR